MSAILIANIFTISNTLLIAYCENQKIVNAACSTYDFIRFVYNVKKKWGDPDPIVIVAYDEPKSCIVKDQYSDVGDDDIDSFVLIDLV